MADVMVGYPGASPTRRKPCGETFGVISNIKVEHIHTMAMNGACAVHVGEDDDRTRQSNF
jgi:hypothetical protein